MLIIIKELSQTRNYPTTSVAKSFVRNQGGLVDEGGLNVSFRFLVFSWQIVFMESTLSIGECLLFIRLPCKLVKSKLIMDTMAPIISLNPFIITIGKHWHNS